MHNQTILLKNIYSLLTDSAKPAISGADLLMQGGIVSQIAPNGGLKAPDGARIINCSSHVVLPGFVNTHHHFYQTLTRNHPAVQNAELFDWLKFLYNVWKYVDADGIYYSSLLAMGELLKTGCTCTTDHHYLYPRGFDGDLMGVQFAAADALGMRFSPTRGSMSLSQKDGGLPPDSVVQTSDEILEDSERVITRYHDNSPMAMHKIVLAPCSPFSVTKELMRDSARLARTHGVRLHTHLAETRDENDFCIEMYGKRPVALMQECELIGPDVFYAHGIHFNDDELRILAETGAHVAHCPSSNMRLGSGIAPLYKMKDKMRVGIAVDGSASNDTNNMIYEIRNALLLQRVKYGADAITSREVLKLATNGGASVLRMDDYIGQIKVGYAADFIGFNLNKLEFAGGLSDPTSAVIFCDAKSVDLSVINGDIRIKDGELIERDIEYIVKKHNEISKKILEKL